MKPKAYIFDLDGTLVDTLSSIAYFGNDALTRFGFSPIPKDRYRYLVGDGAKNLIRRMLAESGSTDPTDFDRVYPYYVAQYHQNPLHLAAPYGGIPELLRQLKADGLKLAVLSNKPHHTTCEIVTKLFGNDLFDAVYGQREGVALKPDPSTLLRLIDKLDATPETTVYLGDTNVDMLTGKRAGCFTVGVLWGFRDEAELRDGEPQAIAAHPDNLCHIAETGGI